MKLSEILEILGELSRIEELIESSDRVSAMEAELFSFVFKLARYPMHRFGNLTRNARAHLRSFNSNEGPFVSYYACIDAIERVLINDTNEYTLEMPNGAKRIKAQDFQSLEDFYEKAGNDLKSVEQYIHTQVKAEYRSELAKLKAALLDTNFVTL